MGRTGSGSYPPRSSALKSFPSILSFTLLCLVCARVCLFVYMFTCILVVSVLSTCACPLLRLAFPVSTVASSDVDASSVVTVRLPAERSPILLLVSVCICVSLARVCFLLYIIYIYIDIIFIYIYSNTGRAALSHPAFTIGVFLWMSCVALLLLLYLGSGFNRLPRLQWFLQVRSPLICIVYVCIYIELGFIPVECVVSSLVLMTATGGAPRGGPRYSC